MVVFEHKTIILDASCVISLYASQYMGEILQTIPREITVAAYVAKKEALYIRGEPNVTDRRSKIPINLQPFIKQGLLTLIEEETETEAEIHINLAAQIRGRGEVITAAIAIHRNWSMIVDDKRARNLFHAFAPHIQILHTLDLVRYWVEKENLRSAEITTILQKIRFGSAFHPHELDPNYGWWQRYFVKN